MPLSMQPLHLSSQPLKSCPRPLHLSQATLLSKLPLLFMWTLQGTAMSTLVTELTQLLLLLLLLFPLLWLPLQPL